MPTAKHQGLYHRNGSGRRGPQSGQGKPPARHQRIGIGQLPGQRQAVGQRLRQRADHWHASLRQQLRHRGPPDHICRRAIDGSIRLAELGRRQAELDREKNRQDTRFELLGCYLDLYKLNNQARVLENNIELAQRVIADMRARREQGTALKTTSRATNCRWSA